MFSVLFGGTAVFRLCDVEQRGFVTRSELLNVVLMFDRLYNGWRHNSEEAQMFVAIAFEKVAADTINFQNFAAIIILHPPIANFFRLDIVAE